MSSKQYLAILHTHKSILQNQYHVQEIALFGSVARDEHKDSSDIDVLVEFSEPVGFFTFIDLENFLSKLLEKKVDLVTRRALKPIIKNQILKEALDKIGRYTGTLSFEEFVSRPETIDAVVRNFEVIGEAGRKISQVMGAQYSDIPWDKIIAMRNKVIHEYFSVDEEILWKTIQEDIPVFKKQIEDMVGTLR